MSTDLPAGRDADSPGTRRRADADPGPARPRDERVGTAVDVLIGIPAYDAAGTVGDVVRAAALHADLVLVVDDGSTDETGARAREAGAVVVTHPVNGGYGAALKTIFREAAARDADRLVILDADGQHDPGDVPRLLAALDVDADLAVGLDGGDVEVAADAGATALGADVVIGSRFADGGATDAPRYRRVGLAIVNGLTNLSLGTSSRDRIRDTQSGFRAYSRRAVASLATDRAIGDRMEASLDVLYHAVGAGYRVVEVGTTISYDVESASSENPLVHGLGLVANIVRRTVRDRPFASAALTASLLLATRSALARRRRR